MADIPNILDFGDVNAAQKNYIINGDFDIWQRGVSFTASGYTADRWFAPFGAPVVQTVTRQAFTVGQTDVPNNPQYFFRNNRTTAQTTANSFFEQRIENPHLLNNESITITFWAKADANKTVLFDIIGRINGVDAAFDTDNRTVSLTTAFQKFTFTEKLPDFMSGAGILSGDYLGPRLIEGSSFSTFTIDIAQVQLEEGKAPTNFEYQRQEEILALCQRYYTNVSLPTALNFPAYADNVVMSWPVTFPVEMRAQPTLTLDTSGWTFVDCDTPTFDMTSVQMARFLLFSTAISINANITGVSASDLTADAEL